MQHQAQERRRRRTDDVELATQYQLEQIIADFGVEAVVLVDDAGRVIAETGHETARQRLASNAMRLAAADRKRRRRVQGVDFACSFRRSGEQYVVAAAGSEREMREVGVMRAILGLRRIRE